MAWRHCRTKHLSDRFRETVFSVAFQNNRIGVGLVQVEGVVVLGAVVARCKNCESGFSFITPFATAFSISFFQLFYWTYCKSTRFYPRLPKLAAVYPKARSRKVPVVKVLSHSPKRPLPVDSGFPVNGIIQFDQSVFCSGAFNKPTVEG